MTGAEWIAAFAAEIGSETPVPAEVETLLELAGVAAHASERIAAPIACWLVGRAAPHGSIGCSASIPSRSAS